MPKLVLARGTITAADGLIIVLNQSDSEPSAVLIVWPAAASVASPTAFPDIAAATVRLFSEAATTLAAIKARRKL
jgi:hypothetical protein